MKQPPNKGTPRPEKPEKEKNYETYLMRECTKRDWLCLKGLVQNRKGWPDRTIITTNRLIVFCEVKRPKGRIAPLQTRTMEMLRKRGIHAFIVRDKEDIDRLINWIENALPTEDVPDPCH